MANNNSTSNVQRWFFIAEKPSLMREVQKCYRNHQKDIINKVGSIDFIALAGHVCGSFFPDDYKNHPEWSGKWDEIDYPIIPQQWGIKALDDKRKKETLKKEIERHLGDLEVLVDKIRAYEIHQKSAARFNEKGELVKNRNRMNIYPVLSCGLYEQPINIVVRKEVLKELAIMHWIIHDKG